MDEFFRGRLMKWKHYQKYTSDAFKEGWNMLKLLFPHGLGTLFPLHFKMRFWSWKSGRAWPMSSFNQKRQEFISGGLQLQGRRICCPSEQGPKEMAYLSSSPKRLTRLSWSSPCTETALCQPDWQLGSFHVLLQNEAATSSMQEQLTVNSVSLMPENQFLQNVHLPCCRYIYLVNCTPSLRTIDYSPLCYRRYLGLSVR